MRDCPNCMAVVDGAKCPACGHTDATAPKAASRVDGSSAVHRCADTRGEARCGKAGALSEGTLGGGPWYCAQHFPPFRNWQQAAAQAHLLPKRVKGSLVGDLLERELERRAMQEGG